MQFFAGKRKINYTIYLIGIALGIFGVGFFPSVVLSGYSNGIYPLIVWVLRAISSLFPFAIGDLLYLILILWGIWQLFQFFKNFKSKSFTKQLYINSTLLLFQIFLVLYISFKLLWGLNYSRPSIAKQFHISNEKYTVKELILLGNYFVTKVNTLQASKTSGQHYTIQQLKAQSHTDYAQLADRNPFFNYQNPSVKPVLSNWLVSKIGIEGYYNPLSAEANVNMKLVPWVLPFVTYHEIAHQLGIAREDEANLVAYLVGRESKNLQFQYSIHYSMLRYILFEIRIKSPEDYIAIRNSIHPTVIADFKKENEFWSKYNGQMSNYMGVAFDKFLKLNQQKRGIKSYQNIVVWLWNIHGNALQNLDGKQL